MIGGGLSNDEVDATRAVMRRAGFDGPCEPVLHSQGEGIAIVVIQVALPIFLQPFLQPVADGAAERLKSFFRDLHQQTRWGRESLQQQVYIRQTQCPWRNGSSRGGVDVCLAGDRRAPPSLRSCLLA